MSGDRKKRLAELAQLEDEIAAASAHEDASTYRLLTALRRFDEAEGWGEQGALSCAHWLSWRTHIGLIAAREKVRVAATLGRFQQFDEAMRTGRISYAKARAISRVITKENESALLDMADHSTGHQLERLCRSFRKAVRSEDRERLTREERWLKRSDTESGMVRIVAQLHPEEAALVLEAIETVMKAERDARRQQPVPEHPPAPEAPTCVEANASPVPLPIAAGGEPASVWLERCAHEVDAQEPAFCRSYERAAQIHPEPQPRPAPAFTRADALVMIAESYVSPRSPAVELVVQVQKSSGKALLPDGMPISPDIARRLSCGAAHVEVEVDELGNLLDSGRRTRAISPAIQRALKLRDGGCRFPGCTHTLWVDAHHVVPWAEGGATKLSNLLLLCRRHHTAVHEGGFRLALEGGAPAFFDPKGQPVLEVSTVARHSSISWRKGRSTPHPKAERRVDWGLVVECLWDATFKGRNTSPGAREADRRPNTAARRRPSS